MKRSPETPARLSLAFMLVASARRVVLSALVTLTALLALPNAAGAALNWGSCVASVRVRCANLTVPLDRSGGGPGLDRSPRSSRAGNTCGPTLMYLSGGPGGAGLSEMLGVVSDAPELQSRFRLTATTSAARAAKGSALPESSRRDPHLRSTKSGGAVRGAARRRPQALHDRGLGRGHGGDPGAAGGREGHALRHLLRHRARDPNTRARTRSTSSG